MSIVKSMIILMVVSMVVVLSTGCVTSGTACNSPVTPKVTNVPTPSPEPQERVVTRDVPGPERVVYRDREVIKEVPGPERIVIKEVEVPAVPTKTVGVLPLVVIPGALFDVDKSALKPHGVIELDRAVQILKDKGYPTIVINGYTDPVGTQESNLKLSERRSETVRAYLESKGIPANTMTTKGYGEHRPVASNKTEEGKALNRRVEIYEVTQ